MFTGLFAVYCSDSFIENKLEVTVGHLYGSINDFISQAPLLLHYVTVLVVFGFSEENLLLK